jgi:deazaflavin-dependent oxidoreductase (nitroreductase family)
MAWRDAFSMRQKPRGMFKWLLQVPVLLYRAGLGRLFGDRFLMIVHRGRRSGVRYRTVVEVVEHDGAGGEYIVCSGTGPRADWYLNLRTERALEVQVGTRSWRPTQRFLSAGEAAATFHRYELAHPRLARRLLRTMGNSYDGSEADRVRMMADMPMVAFSGSPAEV